MTDETPEDAGADDVPTKPLPAVPDSGRAAPERGARAADAPTESLAPEAAEYSPALGHVPIASAAPDVMEPAATAPGRRFGRSLIAAIVVAALLLAAGIVTLILLLNRSNAPVLPAGSPSPSVSSTPSTAPNPSPGVSRTPTPGSEVPSRVPAPAPGQAPSAPAPVPSTAPSVLPSPPQVSPRPSASASPPPSVTPSP